MPNTKPLFRYSHVLATILLWVASSFVLSAEIAPPKATDSELAKASYSEEKKLKDLPSAFIDTSPNAEDGLAVGTLGIDGGKGDSILQFANEIAAGAHGEVDSLLISHCGKGGGWQITKTDSNIYCINKKRRSLLRCRMVSLMWPHHSHHVIEI